MLRHSPDSTILPQDYRDVPPHFVAVNFLPQEFNKLNGPLRQVPCKGFNGQRADPPPLQSDLYPERAEPSEWKTCTLCPATAGSCVRSETFVRGMEAPPMVTMPQRTPSHAHT